MIKWGLYQYAKLAYDKVIVSKPEFRGKFLNLTRDIYKNPRANIFHGKMLKAFSLILRNR